MSTIPVIKKKNFVEKSNNREYKRWLWEDMDSNEDEGCVLK